MGVLTNVTKAFAASRAAYQPRVKRWRWTWVSIRYSPPTRATSSGGSGVPSWSTTTSASPNWPRRSRIKPNRGLGTESMSPHYAAAPERSVTLPEPAGYRAGTCGVCRRAARLPWPRTESSAQQAGLQHGAGLHRSQAQRLRREVRHYMPESHCRVLVPGRFGLRIHGQQQQPYGAGKFKCLWCEHRRHADVNAARNLIQRRSLGNTGMSRRRVMLSSENWYASTSRDTTDLEVGRPTEIVQPVLPVLGSIGEVNQRSR